MLLFKMSFVCHGSFSFVSFASAESNKNIMKSATFCLSSCACNYLSDESETSFCKNAPIDTKLPAFNIFQRRYFADVKIILLQQYRKILAVLLFNITLFLEHSYQRQKFKNNVYFLYCCQSLGNFHTNGIKLYSHRHLRSKRQIIYRQKR